MPLCFLYPVHYVIQKISCSNVSCTIQFGLNDKFEVLTFFLSAIRLNLNE
jgi:hypothetical protein